jgi:PAP2 superfamily
MSRRGLQEVALVLAAVAGYELTRRLIHPSWPVAAGHARSLVALERSLGIAWEAPLQHALAPLLPLLAVVYLAAQFGATGLFFLWLYRNAPDAYPRFRDAFLVATALALVVQWRYPVAPPRFIGLDDTVVSLFHVPVARVTDPLAALPSLHAGWAVGVGVGLWSRSRALAVAYPAVVVLATLATGNHFVLDAAAGAALMAAGFWLSQTLRLRHGATLTTASRGGAVR